MSFTIRHPDGWSWSKKNDNGALGIIGTPLSFVFNPCRSVYQYANGRVAIAEVDDSTKTPTFNAVRHAGFIMWVNGFVENSREFAWVLVPDTAVSGSYFIANDHQIDTQPSWVGYDADRQQVLITNKAQRVSWRIGSVPDNLTRPNFIR